MIPYQNISFPDHLDMRWLGGTTKPDGSYYAWTDYMLLHEFRCFYTRGTGSGVVTGEAGFIFDRSSIPQFARSFIPKDGSWQAISTTHDVVFGQKGVPGCETFEEANALLMAGMLGHRRGTNPQVIRTPWLQRNAIYQAVSSPIGRAIWEDSD